VIVGVGVGTDCCEAVHELLSAIPARSGMAFVVLQRAMSSPGIDPRMLAGVTAMPVVEAVEGMPVRPDRVHLVPALASFGLRDGVLRRPPADLGRLPIDGFFASLARDQRALARAVVLSGVGSDVVQGLLAIRVEGGLAFAQDPASARLPQFQRHAIEAHVVDFVLTPTRIAAELIAHKPQQAQAQARGEIVYAPGESPSVRGAAIDPLANAKPVTDAVRRRDQRHAASVYELSATNEELRSANEELRNANEELHRNREELQFTAEELQSRIAEFERTNDALGRTIRLAGAARDRATTPFETVPLREQERMRFPTDTAQRFLNEAGRLLLAEPLESASMLQKLACFTVPQLGDLCLVDLVGDDRGIRPVVAARAGSHQPPALDAISARLAPDADVVVAEVVRSGSAVVSPRLDATTADALGAERYAWLHECGTCSYLCVPLPGRRGVLGALTLARTRPQSPYAEEDLVLAEGLAQRVGLALENAQLYRAARDVICVRDEFIGVASHELRTPLTALSLQLETLRDLLEDKGQTPEHAPRVQEKVGRALVQVARLGRLIDSVLVVSRISAGVLTLQRDDVDLSEIVRDVFERLAPDVLRSGSTLELEADGSVRGCWDPLRLEQLAINLLSNALRHAPGQPVRVRVDGDEQCARLLVRDEGPGIARELQSQIFERFETAGDRVRSGLGLGLYIARQVAEAHGGTIEVRSEPGRGSTFIVELPRVERGRSS